MHLTFPACRFPRTKQEWTHDKLKRFLENGIMPNLYYAIDFALDDAVLDVILIQGLVQCTETQEIFTGPAYIPTKVRDVTLPVGTPHSQLAGRACKSGSRVVVCLALFRMSLPQPLQSRRRVCFVYSRKSS